MLGPEHLHVSDVDSVQEALQVKLHKEPAHGVVHLGGYPLTMGQAFDLQDLERLKVRSDMLLDSFNENIEGLGLKSKAAKKTKLSGLCSLDPWKILWGKISQDFMNIL